MRSQTKKTATSKTNDDWELNCEVCGMTGKNLVRVSFVFSLSKGAELNSRLVRMTGSP